VRENLLHAYTRHAGRKSRYKQQHIARRMQQLSVAACLLCSSSKATWLKKESVVLNLFPKATCNVKIHAVWAIILLFSICKSYLTMAPSWGAVIMATTFPIFANGLIFQRKAWNLNFFTWKNSFRNQNMQRTVGSRILHKRRSRLRSTLVRVTTEMRSASDLTILSSCTVCG
jgi:hypothetical protein